MALLGFFLGTLAGLFLVKDFSLVSLFSGAALFLIGFLLSHGQKVLRMELIGLAVGAALGSLRFLPYPNGGELRGVVIEAKSSYYVLWTGFHKYYVSERNSLREVGDILLLKGKSEDLAFTTYESRFDFKSYLETKGIFKSFIAKETSTLFLRPFRLRQREVSFLSAFSGETRYLLECVLFGRRDSSSLGASLADSLGLINLFSASGIVYGFIVRTIERFFSSGLHEKKSKTITLIFATFFLFFAPKKIGVWRSYLTRLFSYVNHYKLKDRFIYLDILSFVGLLLLAFDATNAYQMGYLLGFCISFFNYFSMCIVNRNRREWRGVIRLLVVYLVVFPISLSGHTLHFLYPFFSSLMIPLLGIFSFLGWFSFLSTPFRMILIGYSNFLMSILKSMSKLDFSIPLTAPSSFQIALYYFSLFFVLYFWSMAHNGMVIKILIANMALYVTSLVPLVPAMTQEVSFINVGQGDSILIRDGYHAALLDTGGNISFDMAEEVLIPYLRKKRIYHLDYLIASHGDYDHIGAKDSLLKNFSVGKFIDSTESFPLTFGNVTLTNYNHYKAFDENEKSLVLGMDFMDKKWLFMGDAPIEIEEEIIEDHPTLDCDILKAGHHGSKTSSSLDFLKTVTPDTAIISVGYKNHYGHPDKEVIARLESLNIEIRRTDVEGTITYQKFVMPKL